jgi:hypothetical protein
MQNHLTPAPFSRSSRKGAKKGKSTQKKDFDLLGVFAA